MPFTGEQNPDTYDSNLKQLKCHSPALNHYHPPLPLSPISFICQPPHKHTTHNGRHDDDQSAHRKRSSKTQKQKDVQVAACLIPASYWESISSVQFDDADLVAAFPQPSSKILSVSVRGAKSGQDRMSGS
jgi:hypothetical protein